MHSSVLLDAYIYPHNVSTCFVFIEIFELINLWNGQTAIVLIRNITTNTAQFSRCSNRFARKLNSVYF